MCDLHLSHIGDTSGDMLCNFSFEKWRLCIIYILYYIYYIKLNETVYFTVWACVNLLKGTVRSCVITSSQIHPVYIHL